MRVLVFGLANEDSVLPELRRRFPSIGFKKPTASEELEEEGRHIVVMDTVKGIDRVTLIDDLEVVNPGRIAGGSGMLLSLRILLKLKSIDSVKVIAVPHGYEGEDVVEEITRLLGEMLPYEE
ncbi:MAG: hypothetical protein PHF60_03805 [Candidatus ainarchaeum sp.]|nr:hypothetical protein [Candidatus ainarchaeum sp.]